MKVSFFLLKFPIASETFVLDQIVAFIDMGHEVEIIALQRGDLANIHPVFETYNLAEKTVWLLDEPREKVAKLQHRMLNTLRGTFRCRTWRALNRARYGDEARNFVLSSICGRLSRTLNADVFIAHFGPAGVMAVKLRELGLLRGKIATVFHGIDISRYEVLEHYTPEYQRLFERGDLMLPISDLWAGCLRRMGCPAEKIAVSRIGVDTDKFFLRPMKTPGMPLEMLSVASLTEKKGLHIAIDACRLLKARGMSFRYHILGFGPWECRLKRMIEQFQLGDKVLMPGFKPGEEVKIMLDKTDLFLLPCITAEDGDREGIPVALMEAMAVGIPVISTEHSAIPELVDSGISGWLVPEKDAFALADQLQAIANVSARDLQPILANARKKIASEFNQHLINQQLARQLQALYSI